MEFQVLIPAPAAPYCFQASVYSMPGSANHIARKYLDSIDIVEVGRTVFWSHCFVFTMGDSGKYCRYFVIREELSMLRIKQSLLFSKVLVSI